MGALLPPVTATPRAEQPAPCRLLQTGGATAAAPPLSHQETRLRVWEPLTKGWTSESQARPTSLRKRSPAFTTGREVASPALSSMMRARPAVLSGNGAKVHRAVKPGSR